MARGEGLGEVIKGVIAVGNVLGGGLLISANEIIKFYLALLPNVEALKRPVRCVTSDKGPSTT